MPQIVTRGGIEQVRQRLKSLLSSSGLQVYGETSNSMRFRKVRLMPSRRIPLSIYGSGLIRLDEFKKGSTRVTYTLNTSPATVFSFAVTGLSIVILAGFVDFVLLTSEMGTTIEAMIDILVVSLLSFFVILVLISAFVRTRRRSEMFLRQSLDVSSREGNSQ